MSSERTGTYLACKFRRPLTDGSGCATCQLVANHSGFPEELCVVKPDACSVCQSAPQTMDGPNFVVASIVIYLSRQHCPYRTEAFIAKLSPYLRQAPAQKQREVACRHQDKMTRQVTCDSCRGAVRIKVFSCEVHDECTIGKPLKGVACCLTCSDYEAMQ